MWSFFLLGWFFWLKNLGCWWWLMLKTSLCLDRQVVQVFWAIFWGSQSTEPSGGELFGWQAEKRVCKDKMVPSWELTYPFPKAWYNKPLHPSTATCPGPNLASPPWTAHVQRHAWHVYSEDLWCQRHYTSPLECTLAVVPPILPHIAVYNHYIHYIIHI